MADPRTPYPPDPDEDTTAPDELADLVDAVVADADWSNRRVPRLALTRVALRLCRLTGAQLAEATLTDVTFVDCRLDLVALRYAKLERVVFRDCRLEELDLYEASLRDVVFERCALREATFAGATAERVDLVGCDLAAATGVEALRGARMRLADAIANAPTLAAALGIALTD